VRWHPPASASFKHCSEQWFAPDGAPAYPVEMMRPLLEMIAPTCLRPQVDRKDIILAVSSSISLREIRTADPLKFWDIEFHGLPEQS
jgi:hypothetical protein